MITVRNCADGPGCRIGAFVGAVVERIADTGYTGDGAAGGVVAVAGAGGAVSVGLIVGGRYGSGEEDDRLPLRRRRPPLPPQLLLLRLSLLLLLLLLFLLVMLDCFDGELRATGGNC